LRKSFATALFKRHVGQELLTGEENTNWIKDLPVIIDSLNKKYSDNKKNKTTDVPIAEGKSLELLEEGTKVRVQLDEPINVATGARLPGKRRSTDIYWNPKERTIKQILLKPNMPPLYLLDGKEGQYKVEGVAYTKNQLQVIPNNEIPPPLSIIRGKPKQWTIKKILAKKKENGKTFYLIKWLAGDETWEPESNIKEQASDLIDEFNASNKISLKKK
jgi:hypothetical protein